MAVMDYLKLGATDFLSRLGGGGGVNPGAMMEQMQGRRAQQDFLSSGGQFGETSSVPTGPGMPSVPGGSTPFAMNIPNVQQKSVLDQTLELGQQYIKHGLVTKGLGMIQGAQVQKAKIQQAQAEAAAKMAEQRQKVMDSVIKAGGIGGVGLMQKVAAFNGVGMDFGGIELLTHKDYIGKFDDGTPFVVKNTSTGYMVDIPDLSAEDKAVMPLHRLPKGEMGPNLSNFYTKVNELGLKPGSPQYQQGFTENYKADYRLKNDVAYQGLDIKRQKLALDAQNIASQISNRATRTKISGANASTYKSTMKELRKEKTQLDIMLKKLGIHDKTEGREVTAEMDGINKSLGRKHREAAAIRSLIRKTETEMSKEPFNFPSTDTVTSFSREDLNKLESSILADEVRKLNILKKLNPTATVGTTIEKQTENQEARDPNKVAPPEGFKRIDRNAE